MLELRQSTARVIRAGPFVDPSDGVAPVSSITLGAADQAEALKAAGAATVDMSGYTFAAITDADGWYDLSLTASAVDTLGELVAVIQDADACLPVFVRCVVITQNAWDSKYGTDKLEVDAVQAAGESLSAMAELASVPSATPSLVKAIMWLFMKLLNKETATATAETVANSAGVTIASNTLGDDGTTFTRSKFT